MCGKEKETTFENGINKCKNYYNLKLTWEIYDFDNNDKAIW